MNKTSVVITGLLLTSTAFAGVGGSPGNSAAAPGDTSTTSPNVPVFAEEWWFPLRMDAADALGHARYLYRRDNEEAAAKEVRRAASWLGFAADDATEHTRTALLGARTGLLTLAEDLETGKVAGAARMDSALTEASRALAEWHYFRAKDEFGKSDMNKAARDLEAAAAHLENAAQSAHVQYGPDTITVFEDIYRDGKLVSEGKTIDNNRLGEHLDTVENAVETMARALT